MKRVASPTKDGEPVLKRQSRALQPSSPPLRQQTDNAVDKAKDQQKADALKRVRNDVALFRKEIRSSSIYKGTPGSKQPRSGSNMIFPLSYYRWPVSIQVWRIGTRSFNMFVLMLFLLCYHCRHVTLPPQIAAHLPDGGLKTLLRENDYRRLGVGISGGWEHYMIYRKFVECVLAICWL